MRNKIRAEDKCGTLVPTTAQHYPNTVLIAAIMTDERFRKFNSKQIFLSPVLPQIMAHKTQMHNNGHDKLQAFRDDSHPNQQETGLCKAGGARIQGPLQLADAQSAWFP